MGGASDIAIHSVDYSYKYQYPYTSTSTGIHVPVQLYSTGILPVRVLVRTESTEYYTCKVSTYYSSTDTNVYEYYIYEISYNSISSPRTKYEYSYQYDSLLVLYLYMDCTRTVHRAVATSTLVYSVQYKYVQYGYVICYYLLTAQDGIITRIRVQHRVKSPKHAKHRG